MGFCICPQWRRRLLVVARDFYARPRAQLAQACQTRARTKAAYRLFRHPQVSLDALLKPHYAATQQRVAAEPWVFAVQDTTFLNYSAHPATDDRGPMGSEKEAHGPGLLVRAERDRLRQDGQEHLWPWVARQELAGVQEIRVPRRGAQAARVARLEVRFAPVTLRPPQGKETLGEVTLWAVLAQEVDAPPAVKEPLR